MKKAEAEADENHDDKDEEFKQKDQYISHDNEISTLYAPNDIFQTCSKSSALGALSGSGTGIGRSSIVSIHGN